MWYWDENWSEHPMYTHPYVKFDTVRALCDERKCYLRPLKGPRGARGPAAYCKENMMCKGFSADFCVYIDPNSPSGEKTETTVTILVASGTQAVYGELAKVKVRLSWQIK